MEREKKNISGSHYTFSNLSYFKDLFFQLFNYMEVFSQQLWKC